LRGGPPIYVGIYVDNIIYFSNSDAVEPLLSGIGSVDFMGQVSYFLGIEFTWKRLRDGHLCVCLTQQSFIESLLDLLDISIEGISSYSSPYQSGIHMTLFLHWKCLLKTMTNSAFNANCLLVA